MAPSVFSVADTAHRTVLFPPRPARALRYWTPSDRARLAEAFGAALRGWQEQWGLPHGAVDVRCAPPTDVPGTSSPSSWTPLAGAGGVWWAVAGADPSAARPMDPLDAIAWAMLRARNTEAVAARVGAGPADATGIAWGDLERSLASALGGASRARCRPRLDEALRPWSGALVAAAPWCGGRLLVLCDDEAVGVAIDSTRPAGPRPVTAALVSAARPPGAQSVHARVELETAELDVRTLAGLRVGDVLSTQRRLDTPLAVRVERHVDHPERPPGARPADAPGPIGLGRSGRAPGTPRGPVGSRPSPPNVTGARVQLTVALGCADLTSGELQGARGGHLMKLDRRIEEPIDVLLDGAMIARGALVAVDEWFGVRITERSDALERLLDGGDAPAAAPSAAPAPVSMAGGCESPK